MLTEKTWHEFRDTGLLLFINQVLHAFGWAIVVEVDEDGEVTRVYPARTKFRGFDTQSTTEAYKKIGAYIEAEHKSIYKDSQA